MKESESQAARHAARAAHWEGPQLRGSGWLEWRLAAPAAWSVLAEANPFDAEQTDLWVVFEGPGGRRLRTTAFWTRDSQGTGWVVRLLPAVAGSWRATSAVRIADSEPMAVGEIFSFEVTKVPSRQKIGIDPQYPGHFAFDDGSPFVPIGLNMGWGMGSPVEDYKRWFKRLSENGGNFARIWMSSWAFGLEWKDTGLGHYGARLDRAAQLDKVLELAEGYGIRVMLCLINHGAFTEKNDSEWNDNPYNAANGGPLKEPEDFVTDTKARALFARRVRYIAARWSHSPALHSWEWWNEITWTPIDTGNLVPWIREMSAVLDRHDPYRRLRSTSWADRGDAKVWAMPEIDFAQQHDYTTRDLSMHYTAQYRDFRAEVPVKPLLPAELGLETSYDPGDKRPFNWDAVHLHNGLWAPLFRGYAGTALYWWWDLMVDPLKLWPAYLAIARFIKALQESGHRLAEHHPHPAQLSGGDATVMAMLGQHSALLWVRSDLYDVGVLRQAESENPRKGSGKWSPFWRSISGTRVQCSGVGVSDGSAEVRWLDAQTGEWMYMGAVSSASIQAGVLTVDCPTFTQDVAAIVSWK